MGAGTSSFSLQHANSEQVRDAVASLGSKYEAPAISLYEMGITGDILSHFNGEDLNDLLTEIGISSNTQRKVLLTHLAKFSINETAAKPIASIASTGGSRAWDDDKFCSSADETFVFGGDKEFLGGMTTVIKALPRSMRKEAMTNDNGKWVDDFYYVTRDRAIERNDGPNRTRDEGHNGWDLTTFTHCKEALEADLTEAEVVSLRMYTGPFYKPWNDALRHHKTDPQPLLSWATCISVLYNAILKLGMKSAPSKVYRGVNETLRKLPESFYKITPGQFSGGVELGFMSTSRDLNIALEYARKGHAELGSVFVIEFTGASRGASVKWVSQYPHEEELLYNPFTYLTVTGCTYDPKHPNIRFINLSVGVSTNRPDVGNIVTVDDHHEVNSNVHLHVHVHPNSGKQEGTPNKLATVVGSLSDKAEAASVRPASPASRTASSSKPSNEYAMAMTTAVGVEAYQQALKTLRPTFKTGEVKSGKGIFLYGNGDIYEGEWKENKMNGKGVYRWPIGTLYIGDYKDDVKSGKGIYRWPDGKVYEGDFQGDKMNGKGVYKWPDGEEYIGDFEDDKKSGHGIYKWPDGKDYQGDYKDDVKNGTGTQRWPDGKVYEGGFKDDKMHGKGVLRLPDEEVYEGDFQADKMTGKGTYKWPDGSIYQGDYLDDKICGRGIFRWPDGAVYDGDWLDDLRHGRGVNTWPNGIVFEGGYQDGLMHGEGVMTFPGGKVQRGKWDSDKFIG